MKRKRPGSIQPTPATKRVLIVEDHPFMRRGLTEAVNRMPGFCVTDAAGSAEEAIAAVAKQRPDKVREAIAWHLCAIGCGVLTANHGDEARQILAGHPDPDGLILANAEMPGLDAGELHQCACAENRQWRMLLMSFHPDHPCPPGSSLLPKPFSLGQLTSAVGHALHRETSGDGALVWPG